MSHWTTLGTDVTDRSIPSGACCSIHTDPNSSDRHIIDHSLTNGWRIRELCDTCCSRSLNCSWCSVHIFRRGFIKRLSGSHFTTVLFQAWLNLQSESCCREEVTLCFWLSTSTSVWGSESSVGEAAAVPEEESHRLMLNIHRLMFTHKHENSFQMIHILELKVWLTFREVKLKIWKKLFDFHLDHFLDVLRCIDKHSSRRHKFHLMWASVEYVEAWSGRWNWTAGPTFLLSFAAWPLVYSHELFRVELWNLKSQLLLQSTFTEQFLFLCAPALHTFA